MTRRKEGPSKGETTVRLMLATAILASCTAKPIKTPTVESLNNPETPTSDGFDPEILNPGGEVVTSNGVVEVTPEVQVTQEPTELVVDEGMVAAKLELESRGYEVEQQGDYLAVNMGGEDERKLAVKYDDEWLVIPEDTEDWHIPADAEILLMDSGPEGTEIPVVFGAGSRIYKYVENNRNVVEWISDLSEVDMPEFKAWIDQLAVEQLGEPQVPSPQISSQNENWYDGLNGGNFLSSYTSDNVSFVTQFLRYEELVLVGKGVNFHSTLDRLGNRLLLIASGTVDGKTGGSRLHLEYKNGGGNIKILESQSIEKSIEDAMMINQDVAITFFMDKTSSRSSDQGFLGIYFWQEHNSLTKAEFDDRISDFQDDPSKLGEYLWGINEVFFNQRAPVINDN